MLILLILFFLFFFASTSPIKALDNEQSSKFWQIQSIDTMKQSRDMARSKLHDESFNSQIALTVKQIADSGATHISLGTPYDEEFQPYLQKWINEARKNNLHIWFRGNWSGWEGWFSYAKITPEEHLSKTVTFIKLHKDYFQKGDIFSPCPECENGVIGDPRKSGKQTFSDFLINEYTQVKDTFILLDLDVDINYSMNGDVAKLIMDKDTTKKLGGNVVIDHYVKNPEDLNNAVTNLAEISGGKVILGEWGVPIPDINGNLSEESQKGWIAKALELLSKNKNLLGLNYWVDRGGTTALWSDNGIPKNAVEQIKKYYNPLTISGIVKDSWDYPVEDARLDTGRKETLTNIKGEFTIPVVDQDKLIINALGYKEVEKDNLQDNMSIQLEDDETTSIYTIVRFFNRIFTRIGLWSTKK